MENITYLKDLYRFPGFLALSRLKPYPEHSGAMVVTLKRRKKKLFVAAVRFSAAGMTSGEGLSVTLPVVVLLFIWNLIFAVSNVQGVRP